MATKSHPLLFVCLLACLTWAAQGTRSVAQEPDLQEEVKALRERLRKLEQRLESGDTPPSDTPPSGTPPSDTPPNDTPPSDTPPSDAPPSAGPSDEGADLEALFGGSLDEGDADDPGLVDAVGETLDANEDAASEGPTLTLRGFGHASYFVEEFTGKGGPSARRGDNHFALGGLDLFINSKLTDRISFLNETVFELADEEYVLDVERVILKFSVFEWLNVQVGRFHTTVGYWNEHFHHGEYLQTTIGRPRMFDFEDDDGILPVHLMGLVVGGKVLLGEGMTFHYALETGNGRGAVPDPPQIGRDLNDPKALNVALAFSWNGLRVGGNAYFDTIPKNEDPGDGPVHRAMDEILLGFYVTYVLDPWEFLAEYQFINHDEKGARKAQSHAYYLQIAYRIGDFKPYLRYEGLDINNSERYFTSLADEDTFLLGLRWDLASWVALKVQGSWTHVDAPGRAQDGDLYVFASQCSFAF